MFGLYCDAWSYRCSCMGSMSVSSCICCIFVCWVHPVSVLNAEFCMTCSLLMLVDNVRGDQEAQHMAPNDTAYKRWSCHSGHKLLCKFCRTFPSPVMEPDLPCFGKAGQADPLLGWRCSSQKRVMLRQIQARPH